MRRAVIVVSSVLSTLAPAAPAAALDTVDDWRKVGPVEEGDPPGVRAYLSPRAAAELMAAVDATFRGGTVFHAQAVGLESVVQNLRWVFRTKNDVPAPAGDETITSLEAQREKAKEVAVLGVRPAGAYRLLVVGINAVYGELGGGFEPGIFGVVVDAKGKVTDLTVLWWGIGDACFSTGRSVESLGGALHVTHYQSGEGRLCVPEETDAAECCGYLEGEVFEPVVLPDGRLREERRRQMNFSGQYEDGGTGEQLLVEDPGHGGKVRVGYRTRAKPGWRRLEVLGTDRVRSVLVVRFRTGSPTYELALGASGTLVSRGSDASKAQRFERVPEAERHRNE